MGNKNARGKRSLDLPRLTLPGLPAFPPPFIGDTSELNGSAAANPMSPLPFKSFRQGTLITPNFEVVGKFAAKSLSATSPEFVPAVPSNIAPAPNASKDTSSMTPAVEKLQVKPDMVDRAPVTGTHRHDYTEIGGLGASSKLPMKMNVGMISTNRTRPNSTDNFGFDQMATAHASQHEMNALSISSVNSTPDKSGSSSFITPTKPNESPLSTPSPIPTGPRPEKSRFGRADKKKKDIIITQLGVIRNLTRITDRFTENGYPYKHVCADEFQPDVYDIAAVVRGMQPKERAEFWSKNWVDIEVDFRTDEEVFGLKNKENGDEQEQEQVPKNYDTLLNHIDHLGPDFAAHAKYIFISILFPSLPSSEDSKPTPSTTTSVLTSQQTPEFQHLSSLVLKLQHFPSIKRLEIILVTPSNTKKPLSIPQLNLVLPFYDLAFTDWNIKWKTSFMTKAEPVGGWPIHYLDKERNRLLRERERVRDAVFVRKSQFVKN